MHHNDIVWLTDDALAADLHLHAAYLTIHRASYYLLLGHTRSHQTAEWHLSLTGNHHENAEPLNLGVSGPVTAQRRASLLLADHVPTVHAALTLQRSRGLGADTAWALVRDYAGQHRDTGYNPALDAFTTSAANHLVNLADQAITPTTTTTAAAA